MSADMSADTPLAAFLNWFGLLFIGGENTQILQIGKVLCPATHCIILEFQIQVGVVFHSRGLLGTIHGMEHDARITQLKHCLLVFLPLIAGLYLTWTGTSGVISASMAKSWPTVQGMLRTKEIWMRYSPRGGTSYVPLMTYSYEVNGNTYTGEKISTYNLDSNSREDAQDVIDSYSADFPLTVHYSPSNPANAVLQIGSIPKNLAKAGIGCGALLVGLFFGRAFWEEF
jgi:Protein of unknown function (DUF3592)